MNDSKQQSHDDCHNAAALASGDEQHQRFGNGHLSRVWNFKKSLPHNEDQFLIDVNDFLPCVLARDSGNLRAMDTSLTG